jgi:nicotinamide riboside kinase
MNNRKILVTGPESTGKTELAAALTRHFGGTMVPEYARRYVEGLKRPYRFADVEHIAQVQAGEYETAGRSEGWIFFDTWLIITRTWMEVVWHRVPGWVDRIINEARFDLVLLCGTDLPWVADPVRENGGERREMLLETYIAQLERLNWKWRMVTGRGPDRVAGAIYAIEKNLRNGNQ